MCHLNRLVYLLILILFAAPAQAQVHKNNVAVCGSSVGYSYYAERGLAEGDILGWSEAENLTGSITLKYYEDESFDILFTDATLGAYSAKEEGAVIVPVSLSDKAVSIVAVYPMLSETYVFQKLKDGEYEVMWTQSKSETPLPKIAAWVGKCSYLNLRLLKSF